MLCILICFSYRGNKEFCIREKHTYSDIRKAYDYCVNTLKCNNVFIISDLDKSTQWNGVQYIKIDKTSSFTSELKKALISREPLFLYYSGHGIIDDSSFSLLIPKGKGHTYYSKYRLIKRLRYYLRHGAFIVFDCCYGQRFLDLAGEGTHDKPKLIFISSCSKDQLCGFDKEGSIFSNYFFDLMNSGVKNLSEVAGLQTAIDKVAKKKQNIIIQVDMTNDISRIKLPHWMNS